MAPSGGTVITPGNHILARAREAARTSGAVKYIVSEVDRRTGAELARVLDAEPAEPHVRVAPAGAATWVAPGPYRRRLGR